MTDGKAIATAMALIAFGIAEKTIHNGKVNFPA
jgi:hypothetical protein